jgi:hypothetical protein
MKRIREIFNLLNSIYPNNATNSEIVNATGIHPHQQVFQKTRELLELKIINGWQDGRVWHFQSIPGKELNRKSQIIESEKKHIKISPREFEVFSRKIFSNYFGNDLRKGYYPGVKKEWDFLSDDLAIVGDAKYYTLVGGKGKPPAKFSTIAEHVWLLEKTNAITKFLVFGNQIEVPKLWLAKYGDLVSNVNFYFLNNEGEIIKLN